MKRRNVIIMMFVLLLIAAFGAYTMYNKPHVDVLQAKAFQTLTANELVDEFNTDEEQANTQYIDQVLEVSGIVSSIETNNQIVTVYLQSSDLLKSVSCEIDGDLDANIEVGDQVNVRGICAGSLMDVVLVQCKII